jgi:hypothetical protein
MAQLQLPDVGGSFLSSNGTVGVASPMARVALWYGEPP